MNVSRSIALELEFRFDLYPPCYYHVFVIPDSDPGSPQHAQPQVFNIEFYSCPFLGPKVSFRWIWAYNIDIGWRSTTTRGQEITVVDLVI